MDGLTYDQYEAEQERLKRLQIKREHEEELENDSDRKSTSE